MQVMDKHGEAHPSIFSRGQSGRLNSLSVVLSQEVDRFNKLTKQMKSSLKELQKAIKGLVVMSNELEQMLHSMLDSKVCVCMCNATFPPLHT
jgi:dynein heavy chain, axonemal